MLPYVPGSAGQDRETVAAVKPALATVGGRLIVLSTPLGREGVHYERVEQLRGQLDGRAVAFIAPTWVANPACFPDAASTRDLEEDERVWAREYEAEPGEADNSAFAADDLECCVDRGRRGNDPKPGVRYAVGFDEGGRRAARALVVVHRELNSAHDGGFTEDTVVDLAVRWQPGQKLDHDSVMAKVAQIAKRYNNATVQRDLFAGDAVGSALARHGAQSTEVSMSSNQQAERFRDLQRLVESHRLRLPDDEQLLRELRGLRESLHQGGRVVFSKGAGKLEFDDLVDALALAVARAQKLPPSGGDIVIVKDRRFIWRPDAGGLEVTPRTYARRVNGQLVPHEPPPGPEAEAALEARLARGDWSPADEERLGIEEIRRRILNGGVAPAVHSNGLGTRVLNRY